MNWFMLPWMGSLNSKIFKPNCLDQKFGRYERVGFCAAGTSALHASYQDRFKAPEQEEKDDKDDEPEELRPCVRSHLLSGGSNDNLA